jgi:hypothetical protein
VAVPVLGCAVELSPEVEAEVSVCVAPEPPPESCGKNFLAAKNTPAKMTKMMSSREKVVRRAMFVSD